MLSVGHMWDEYNKKIEDIQEMPKVPDGTYKLVGYQKHGPYPGLPGIGHWSTYVNNGSGSIGSRSGLMLHNDIGSNGTLGCIGVELGGTEGTKRNKSF